MTHLIPMSEQDFQTYLGYAIADYAQDHIQAGRWKPEDALQRATEEYRKFLPDGLKTPDQFLYMIEDETNQQLVGLLWFGIEERGGKRRAIVYDIIIYEQFRRHGYGEQAFLLLEEKVRALNLAAIGLHVFGSNHAALALYQKLGYQSKNIHMEKQLS